MIGQKTASRRTLLASALCGTVLTSWGLPALAQNQFPSKTMSFVVPYPAGGANDMLGRLIGQKMAEALNGTAMVDNKPGAAAMLGASAVARAPADGHTLLIGGLATHAASPNMLKADYDPLKDFESVGMIGSAPIIAITFNESPYKTLKDVVEAARKDPKGVMYGSSGNGSPLHLAGELFTSQNKIDMTHVPYKGGNAHIMDLIGGRVPVIFDTATNLSLIHI
jgi:tripartite-type tricarboxylate transporter receptor subunit TctC